MKHFRRLLLLIAPLVPWALTPALAGPNGASVVAGSATVQGQGTANVIVNQSSQKAIINWNTFNIGAGQTTTINMPGASSTELDRVTGGLGPSQIFGSLTSNGQVFLVNPDGILFGKGARVNTGSFLATTHDIVNADFMAGRFNFFGLGNPAASIVNQGMITARTGGFAALVAPGVRNTGVITAKLGSIALASGNAFTLDFYGDNLIKLGLNDSIASQVIDVATGKPLSSLVSNEGTLKANGGRVALTAVAARTVVDSVINNTGVIEADTIGTHNGMIVLGAATAASKPAGAPAQTVKVSGTLSASGKRKGTKGGTIIVTGENVQLAGATLDASGQAGGGAVLVGGDWGGGHPNTGLVSNPSAYLERFAVPNASTVSVDAATTINASATNAGNGGKVIVWSNEATTFYGTILARGGAQSGDGGFVETSGHELSANGSVNTSAPKGVAGTWLLDPLNASIAANPGSEVITVSSIENALATGNVVVTTVGTSGGEPGDITVAASVSWANANLLLLDAYRNITVNDGVTIANTGAGNLVLRADATGLGVGTVNFLGTGKVDFSGSTGTVSIFYNPADNPAGSAVNSTSYTTPFDYSPYVKTNSLWVSSDPAVPQQFAAYMLVNSVYDLQNIQNNLSGNYALGKDIDASATASWNGGAGFVPIGDGIAGKFSGIFDGQGHSINDLTINYVSTDTSENYIGLFGYIDTSGVVRNVSLTNASVSGTFPYGYVGSIAGWNSGTIANVTVDGTVNADGSAIYPLFSGGLGLYRGNGTVAVGGLVGSSSGTISQSQSNANVSASDGIYMGIGGLVGNNEGTISQSFATGSVSNGGFAYLGVGGLVGYNIGAFGSAISQSYASGAVNGGQAQDGIGGLVGGNFASISQSYATGSVTGAATYGVGGLAATWIVSVEKLTRQGMHLLELCGYLDPAPIPKDLLAFLKGDPDYNGCDALSDLFVYSLAQQGTDATSTFSVHRLVQDFSRRRIGKERQREVLQAALNWIDRAFVGRDGQGLRVMAVDRFAPHAAAVCSHGLETRIAEPTTRLMTRFALSTNVSLRPSRNETLYRLALEAAELNYGPCHPQVATALKNLAGLLQFSKRFAEAEPFLRRALMIEVRHLGTNHRIVAIMLSDLGKLLQDTHRYAEAEKVYRRAVKAFLKLDGPDHPVVATHLSRLAEVRSAMERQAPK